MNDQIDDLDIPEMGELIRSMYRLQYQAEVYHDSVDHSAKIKIEFRFDHKTEKKLEQHNEISALFSYITMKFLWRLL